MDESHFENYEIFKIPLQQRKHARLALRAGDDFAYHRYRRHFADVDIPRLLDAAEVTYSHLRGCSAWAG